MKAKDLRIGMKVVTCDSPTAFVYDVERIAGSMALLVYEARGRRAIGGEVDASILSKPTKEQLENHGTVYERWQP